MADEKQLPFLQHIDELRERLIRTLIGIFVATALALFWIEPLVDLLLRPAREIPGGSSFTFIGTAPADAFVAKLKVALAAGFLLSLPYSLFQFWRFVEPGLHEHEKRLTVPFVTLGTLFFIFGAGFFYIVVCPIAFAFFLAEYRSIDVQPYLRLSEYFSFIVTLLLVFGLIFELPIVSYILTRLRIIHHRWLIRQTRAAIVVIFIVAAIITPPDVVSQLCLAFPLLILYGLCIGVSYIARHSSSGEGSALSPPELSPAPSSVPVTGWSSTPQSFDSREDSTP